MAKQRVPCRISPFVNFNVLLLKSLGKPSITKPMTLSVEIYALLHNVWNAESQPFPFYLPSCFSVILSSCRPTSLQFYYDATLSSYHAVLVVTWYRSGQQKIYLPAYLTTYLPTYLPQRPPIRSDPRDYIREKLIGSKLTHLLSFILFFFCATFRWIHYCRCTVIHCTSKNIGGVYFSY